MAPAGNPHPTLHMMARDVPPGLDALEGSAKLSIVPMDTLDESPEALVEQLVACRGKVPEELREKILGAGEAVAAPLLALLGDVRHWPTDANPRVGASRYAAELLGELAVPSVVAPMVAIFACVDVEAPLSPPLDNALAKKGAAVVEPALALLCRSMGQRARDTLRRVLFASGVKDDRVLNALMNGLYEAPGTTAYMLGELGDARALPALYAAAALHRPDFIEEMLGNLTCEGLVGAIEALDGDPPIALARKLEAYLIRGSKRMAEDARASGRLQRMPTSVPPTRRTGPCPCGSNKLYKHCCIART